MIETGFKFIDELTGGLKNGHLIVGSRIEDRFIIGTANGKSVFDDILINIASNFKVAKAGYIGVLNAPYLYPNFPFYELCRLKKDYAVKQLKEYQHRQQVFIKNNFPIINLGYVNDCRIEDCLSSNVKIIFAGRIPNNYQSLKKLKEIAVKCNIPVITQEYNHYDGNKGSIIEHFEEYKNYADDIIIFPSNGKLLWLDYYKCENGEITAYTNKSLLKPPPLLRSLSEPINLDDFINSQFSEFLKKLEEYGKNKGDKK